MISQRTYSTEVLVSVGLSWGIGDVLMMLCKGEAVFAHKGEVVFYLAIWNDMLLNQTFQIVSQNPCTVARHWDR